MVNVDFFPERSSEGKAALDIFYSGFNDVNFYVEDEDQENLYYEILKRKFPDVKFEKIFPLGGKKNVISHAKDPQNSQIANKLIYILDKDFDDFLGIKVQDTRIFYLERYCIENYLIDEYAIANVILETHPKIKLNDILSNIAMQDWEFNTVSHLTYLFVIFFCVQKLGLGIKNCDGKPEEYAKSPRIWEVDTDKIQGYLELVLASCSGMSMRKEFLDNQELILRLVDEGMCCHKLISGKFMLAMLFHYVKSKYKMGSISFDSFVFRTAKNSDLSALSPVLSSISLEINR